MQNVFCTIEINVNRVRFPSLPSFKLCATLNYLALLKVRNFVRAFLVEYQ